MRPATLWTPPIVWSCVLLLASSDLFSASHTGSFLADILTWIVGHPVHLKSFGLVHFLLRKAGHLTAYGILGYLWLRAVRGGRMEWSWRWAAYAIAMSVAVAAIDEWHQTFIPSRTGTATDVLVDAAGASIAQLIARWRIGVILKS